MSLPSDPYSEPPTPPRAGPFPAMIRDIRAKILSGLLAAAPIALISSKSG